MDSALTMTEIPTSYYVSTGELGGEEGRPAIEAADGHVVVMTGRGDMTKRLLVVLGVTPGENEPPELPATSRSGLHREAIASWCRDRTRAEICETLERADVPVAPVLSIPEVAELPHLWEREMLVETPDPIAGEIYVPGLTIKFSKSPGAIGPVPTAGEHTDEILSRLADYDARRIAELRAHHVI
jgi:formyl-CoA transferase